MGTKCNGCSAVINDISYMECAQEKCKKVYHLKCLALSKKQFEKYTDEFKTNWRCPECTRSVPKGNNSDTPVRGSVDIISTPSSCYVNTKRGNRAILDEATVETEDKLLEELREFRWEMKSRLEEQSKEYALLLDRFFKAELELREVRQYMRVVVEKANKVDLLESKVKSLLERNERLEAECINNESQQTREPAPALKGPVQSFVNAVKKNQMQVISQKCGATKQMDAVIDMETTQRTITENRAQKVKPLREDKNNRERDGTWTVVNRKSSRYPHSEVKKGGSTQTTEIKGAEKQKFLHVWRLQKDTTKENLETFIRNIVKDVPIKVEKIKHKTERDYASFIVGLPVTKYDQLCHSEVWPVNVEFCEWVWFRRSANHPRSENETSK